MKDINVELSQGVSNTVFRTQEIPVHPIVVRRDFVFLGNIRSPFNYYSSKQLLRDKETRHFDFIGNPQFDLFDMVVQVNRESFSIEFIENNHHDIKTAAIKGNITFPKELDALGINKDRKWSALELADKLKMNRVMFPARDENLKIVAALKNFKARVETDLENSNDLKGNKINHYAQQIRQEHDLRFKVQWPVIVGEPPMTFEVEINFDLRDKAIEFWLESVEMKELQEREAATLLDAEIAKFIDRGVTVISK